jgi:hypothetical protein
MDEKARQQLLAIVCALMCAATIAWMFLCNVFGNTYFRPLFSEIEKQGMNAFGDHYYHVGIECGVRLWEDAFVPSTFTLFVCLAFSIYVAVKSWPTRRSEKHIETSRSGVGR